MRLFFYLLSPLNLRLGYFFCDLIALVALALNTEIVKISRININIAYSSKNKEYRESLLKRSIKQSIRSYYETLFCFSRSQKLLNKSIFKVENRYLYSQTNKDFGLILLSIHNRSVDLLLNQLSNQEDVTAIFKPIKIKAFNELLDRSIQKYGISI